jgi:hypothetical protein
MDLKRAIQSRCDKTINAHMSRELELTSEPSRANKLQVSSIMSLTSGKDIGTRFTPDVASLAMLSAIALSIGGLGV